MSTTLATALFAHGDDMNPSPFWVLMALCDHVNEDDVKEKGWGMCWPALSRISQKAHVSEATARRAIKELVSSGIVKSSQEPGRSRIFTISLEKIKGLKECEPLTDSTGPSSQILKGSPNKSDTPPLTNLAPEPIKEPVKEPRTEHGKKQDASRAKKGEAWKKWIKVEKPKATRAKPKTSCPFSPDDPIPPECLEYAQAKHPSINAQTEFTKFVNFHLSKDNRYSNWLAAWRTWATKAEEFAKSRPQSQSYTPARRSTDPQAGWVSTQTPTNPPPLYTPEEREALKKKYQAMTAIFAKTDKNV